MSYPVDKRVILYFADWCGHCTRFKPEWEILKKMLRSKGVSCAEYEADADRNVIPSTVTGYPTIIVDGVPYRGERSAAAIMALLGENDAKKGTDSPTYKLSPTGDSISGGSKKFQQCGEVRKGKHVKGKRHNLQGGRANDMEDNDEEYYKMKYYKYKAKYMKLRNDEL